METKQNKLYLKDVSLSGYKSIEDVHIEFEEGLNIIIGKNAAGKTNFLQFLNKSLLLDYKALNNFKTSLKFQNGKEILLETTRTIAVQDLFNENNKEANVKSKLYISKKLVKEVKGEETSIGEKLVNNDVKIYSSFLCHGIPNEYLLADKPISFKVNSSDRISLELFNLLRTESLSYFTKSFAINVILAILDKTGLKDDFTTSTIKKALSKVFKSMEGLKIALQRYSPIEDLRFSDNFNIFINENREDFQVNNIFLEFKIAGDWLPFSSLSDGTKRLFFIISEIFEIPQDIRVKPTNQRHYYGRDEISRIVLIEEPELGIHPHQFHKLLEFLKESSSKMQIIMTTHSPQALDSIDQDELQRIIIAYSTPENGTKLRHLNNSELFKANEYIKDDFLSDYWLYSDLEE